MRTFAYLIICTLCLFSLGCESVNSQLAVSAALDAVKAATLTGEQVRELSNSAAVAQDEKNELAPSSSPYVKRLARLVRSHQAVNGLRLDIKVYLSDQVNAFAMANGTVRVYSGLMDLMSDHELLFVIGHEIGHIHHGHTKKKAQVAYSTSALRKGVGSLGGVAGQLILSDIGAFSEKIINAQYSQKEEIQADDFGYAFMLRHGYPPEAAVTGLRKLGGGGGGILASHPDSNKRSDRIKSKIPVKNFIKVP